MNTQTIQSVKEYYGKELQGTKDLKTSACCTPDDIPDYQKKLLANVHEEVLTRFYGCGSPIPPDIKGLTILDLGSGTGRDAYMLSQLVGETGKVIGIDMTDEQLEIANKHIDYHMQKFGFKQPNVEFIKGQIEDLKTAGIQDNSVDIVISNCVINLATNKEAVFKEIFRILKPGGELFFSDIFSGRRIPHHLKEDPILYGECLSGAMYTEDFRRLLNKIGILDFRTLNKRRITLDNKDIEQKAGMIDFYSITLRAFKLELEDICEDYGQTATYNGTIKETPHQFELDNHHKFITGKPMLVCGNTADMVSKTRFAKHFTITGEKTTHFGPFDCSPQPSNNTNENASGPCC